jgi:hypothetical protein
MGRIDIDTPTDHHSKKNWQRVVIGLAVSLISIGLLIYFTDLKRFIQTLEMANYPLVAAAAAITLLWLAVRGIVWRVLLLEKATYSQVYLTLNEGYLLNNFLPFRLGEVGRAFLLGRKARLDFWQVLSSILIERALDVAIASGLLLGSLPFVVGASWARQAAPLSAAIIVLVFLALVWLARNRQPAEQLFQRLSNRWAPLKRLGVVSVPAFFNGLAVLTDMRRFLKATTWMLVNWLVAGGQYFVFLRAFSPDARPLWALFSLGVSSLGIAAPSSPGAVGVLEISLVGSLALFGVNPSISLAFALTMHLCQYLITGVIGVYALVKDGESLASLYLRTRNLPSGGESTPPPI